MKILRAISIREPWVWAIRCAGKRVENRSRETLLAYRGPVLLHTGVTCTRADFTGDIGWMADEGLAQSYRDKVSRQTGRELPVPPKNVKELALGGFGARAVVVGCRWNDVNGHVWAGTGEAMRCAGCGGTATRDGRPTRCPKPDPWANPGAVGILLDKVEPLPCFVPWRGNLAMPFKVVEEEFALLLATHLARRPLDLEELIALSVPHREPGPIHLPSLDALLDRGDLVDDGGRLRPPSYRPEYPIYR